MEELEEGRMYVVTTKHAFVFPFSHYEELPNGQKVACFKEPGQGRNGVQYRKVVPEAGNVLSITPVE